MTPANLTDLSPPVPAWRVHGALLVVQVIFALFYSFGKQLMHTVDPMAVAGLRAAMAAAVLFSMSRMMDKRWPERRDLPYLALLGLLGVTLNQLLFIIGLHYSRAIEAGILMTAIPVFAAAAAIILRVEPPSPWRVGGVAVAVCGALVMLNLAHFDFSRQHLLGNLLLLGNALAYAFYLVLQRPILKRLPPMTVLAWAFVFGAVFLIPVCGPAVLRIAPATWDARVWQLWAFVILGPTSLNYFLNSWAIRHSSPTVTAAYVTLQPPLTVLPAMILLGEHAAWRDAIGCALILAGLGMVARAGQGATQPIAAGEAQGYSAGRTEAEQ